MISDWIIVPNKSVDITQAINDNNKRIIENIDHIPPEILSKLIMTQDNFYTATNTVTGQKLSGNKDSLYTVISHNERNKDPHITVNKDGVSVNLTFEQLKDLNYRIP